MFYLHQQTNIKILSSNITINIVNWIFYLLNWLQTVSDYQADWPTILYLNVKDTELDFHVFNGIGQSQTFHM